MRRRYFIPGLFLLLNLFFYFGMVQSSGARQAVAVVFVAVIASAVVDWCLFNLFPSKIYGACLVVVQTFFKIGLLIYYKEFASLMFFERIGLAKEATSVLSVIKADFNLVMALMAMTGALLVFCVLRGERSAFSWKRSLLFFLAGVGAIVVPGCVVKGLFGTEMYSTMALYPVNKRIEARALEEMAAHMDIESFYKDRHVKTNRFTGIAKDMNVIYIQCESLQNTFVNRKYNGEEITPFLNSLIQAKGTIYFDDYFELLGMGNTSDAEFVSMSSVYPTLRGQAYGVYEGRQSYAMPTTARAHGYETVAMHGNTGKFYDRDRVYPKFQFNHIYLGENYDQRDQVIMGLSDKSFFDQSADYLDEISGSGKKFFALMVTLSTHTPFDLPEGLRTIEREKGDDTDFVYNYVNCARYTDDAMRAFFEKLAQKGLLDKTVIVIYGDHHAMTLTNKKNRESMERWLGKPMDYDTMMNIPLVIKVPGLEENVRRHTIGSQVDLYPTLLNLLGWDRSQIPTFGVDLLGDEEDVKDNVVFPQTHLVKGSFITKDYLFDYAQDGIFSHSRLVDRKTRQVLPVEGARELSTRAMITTDYCNRLMEGDVLEELIAPQSALPQAQTIMRAGGAINGQPESNTLSALDVNYKRGKRFFDISFSATSDGHYIGLRDWDGFMRRFYVNAPHDGKKPISLKKFMKMEEMHGWKQLDLAGLSKWLKAHPDGRIVTETKGDNIKFLSYIETHFPAMRAQLIPQVYSEAEYHRARAMGFDQVIYNLDRTEDSVDGVVAFAHQVPLYGVAISREKWDEGDWSRITEADKAIFVYTVNQEEDAQALFQRGVQGIFTDKL